MSDINSLLLVFHVITAIIIVVLILLQKGKGADMGSAFGVSNIEEDDQNNSIVVSPQIPEN